MQISHCRGGAVAEVVVVIRTGKRKNSQARSDTQKLKWSRLQWVRIWV